MKLQHIWSVLCRESMINQDDNVISIHGVIEQFQIKLVPPKPNLKRPEKFALPLNYEVVSYWYKPDTRVGIKGEVEYILQCPKGEELFKTIHPLEIPSNIKRFRSRMKIKGITVKESGDYQFLIRFKESGEKEYKVVSTIPLEVNIQIEEPKENKSN